ncbi:hypothetical protein MJO28_007825 [Puccinia striiformis f. sp. tritici]|uniref:Uncharacterized protein n=1 Tax=Puccinia striiformis f. sp. tritici TaxID=168172 RepID=A0ACC0EFX2_9BASI|nr:hypothetical protein MJO28_007825 [Puccinia striiformis f. sp. tritici]
MNSKKEEEEEEDNEYNDGQTDEWRETNGRARYKLSILTTSLDRSLVSILQSQWKTMATILDKTLLRLNCCQAENKHGFGVVNSDEDKSINSNGADGGLQTKKIKFGNRDEEARGDGGRWETGKRRGRGRSLRCEGEKSPLQMGLEVGATLEMT